MSSQPESVFFTFSNNALTATSGQVVREYPLQLNVNGREIATLIGSPHDLRFLVAGFLRLQGFVQQLSDFEMFSVCEDFGSASVRIKGELPERLKPVLTSGCGTGISFSLPQSLSTHTTSDSLPVSPEEIFSLMAALSNRADQYKSHGGIHSAAVGRGGDLLLYAEDLGRHNTLDRIAGEALFKGIDLSGTMLVTSGRVSTEMVAKAALVGVKMIASRTSPTDMAVRLCQESNICLIGYVRGGKFTVYAHPEQIEPWPEEDKIAGVTAAILAGGASRRMGTNKSLLEIDGEPIILRTYRTLAHLFREVIVVTNTPEEYPFLPCRMVPDVHIGCGAIAGLHSALVHSSFERTFVTACDMPSLDPDCIRKLCMLQPESVAVVPVNLEGLREPLHAIYNKQSLAVIEDVIVAGDKSILVVLDKLDTREVCGEDIGASDSLRNINTPEDFELLKGKE